MVDQKKVEAVSDAVMLPYKEDLARRVNEHERMTALNRIRSKGAIIGGLIGCAIAVFLYFAFALYGDAAMLIAIPILASILGGGIAIYRARTQQALAADSATPRG